MSEEANARRISDTKDVVMQEYRDDGFLVVKSDNECVCFIAYDLAHTGHSEAVRICTDEITEYDVKMLFALPSPSNQRKVMICQPYKARKRIKQIYDYMNNRCQ
jgi:hypothetical protein